MGELIYLREFEAQRRRSRSPIAHRAELEQAVQVLKENLAAIAAELCDAPAEEQAELLARVEKLAAMVGYGLRMLGHELASTPWPDPVFNPR
jgi:hypothetical protein